MKRKRDGAFLVVAAVAGLGGLGAIGAGIGLPLYSWMHGGHAQSTFFFFSLWGIAALCGAAANVYTYLQSGDPPDKPPRGGQPAVKLRLIDGRAQQVAKPERDRRAA
jgi:hypothetical protein